MTRLRALRFGAASPRALIGRALLWFIAGARDPRLVDLIKTPVTAYSLGALAVREADRQSVSDGMSNDPESASEPLAREMLRRSV
jgi:hypothetical protein